MQLWRDEGSMYVSCELWSFSRQSQSSGPAERQLSSAAWHRFPVIPASPRHERRAACSPVSYRQSHSVKLWRDVILRRLIWGESVPRVCQEFVVIVDEWQRAVLPAPARLVGWPGQAGKRWEVGSADHPSGETRQQTGSRPPFPVPVHTSSPLDCSCLCI